MFEVLHRDESEEEDKPKKQTKHEQRATDKQKREATGDHVQKDNYHQRNAEGGKPQKNTYSGDGQRTHDRQSGTGKNTFNKAEKKGGGGGKGNWGKADLTGDNEEGKAEVGEKKEGENDQPEEQAEPVLTLDDYMKENSMKMDTKLAEGEQQGFQTQKAEKGFKVLKPKEADWVEPEQKSKNIDNISKAKTNIIEGAEPQGYRRNQNTNTGKGKGGKKAQELKNEDFPSL